MVATPAPVHEESVCQAAFLTRLSTLDDHDLAAAMELLECMKDAPGDERPEIARALVELLYPRIAYAGLETDKPLTSDARDKVDDYRKQVGKRIARRRAELGMTQAQLAKQANLPQSHVSRLECGKLTATYLTIERLARALLVDAGWLDPGCDD